MKSYFALSLLILLSVSCGAKNKSGGSNNEAPKKAVDSLSSHLTGEQEINFIARYKTAAQEVLEKNRRRMGEYNYKLIQIRFNEIQFKLDYNEFGSDQFQITNSYFDGYSMLLYVGDQHKNLNWRRLLDKGGPQTEQMLYEDLLSMRGNGSSYNYSYSKTSTNSGSYKKYHSRNYQDSDKGSVFYYEFSTEQ